MKVRLAICILVIGCLAKAGDVTPTQYLQLQAKPQFKPGHHLYKLTSAGFAPFPWELRVELATNWGYALDASTYNATFTGLLRGIDALLADPTSDTAKAVALVNQFPDTFKLWANIDRDIPPTIGKGFWTTNADGMYIIQTGSTSNIFPEIVYGNTPTTKFWYCTTNPPWLPLVSTGSDDAEWAAAAEYWVAPLRTLHAAAPITYLMNMGEYGLANAQSISKAVQYDPRQITAMATNGLSLPRYIAQQKGRQLAHVTDAVRTALPNRALYWFYHTGNEQTRFKQPGYDEWEDTFAQSSSGWDSAVMNDHSDLPSFQDYFTSGSSWTNATGTAWSTVTDLLTHHLDAYGYNVALGATNIQYNWVSGGYHNTDSNRLADIPRYKGFLKCLYVAGQVGGNAGYYVRPTGTTPSIFGSTNWDGTFPTNIPPHWLLQLQALAYVHAIFTYLEDYIYGGDLASGPEVHWMATDQPSYEFVNTDNDKTVRVLARKLRTKDEWLVVAWSAFLQQKTVTVTLTNNVTVSLAATDAGSLYRVTKPGDTAVVKALDDYGQPVETWRANRLISGQWRNN